MTPRLLVIGAGGLGRAVAEAVLLRGEYELTGFADDAWENLRDVWGYPELAGTDALGGLRSQVDVVIVAIGNNAVRKDVHATLRASGLELATIVHPKAWVSPRASLGAGCVVMAGAVVGTEARLGMA